MTPTRAGSFVGERLREAREVRGLTAIALAEMLDVSRQAVSQYEKNLSAPSQKTMAEICQRLNLNQTFFFRPVSQVDVSPIFYRSLSTATKSARCRAERRFSWMKEIVQFLREHVSFPKVSLPDFDAPLDPRDLTSRDIETLAIKTRRHWKLGDGPISNVTWLLENNGIVMARHELGADSLDAFSQWSEAIKSPCIVLGSDKDSCARSRFDASHELGHLLLHRRVPDKMLNKKDVFRLMEDQAHLFAGAFLLPQAAFAEELFMPSLDAMRMLKSKWKVAIAAMIHRACDLGLLNEDRQRRMWINLTQRGWRVREPLDDVLEVEQPRYLKRCVELLMENQIVSRSDWTDRFGFYDREFESLCTLPSGLVSEAVNDPEPQILAFKIRKNG